MMLNVIKTFFEKVMSLPYAPERHYMRGGVDVDKYLSNSIDLVDLEQRQQALAKKGIY